MTPLSKLFFPTATTTSTVSSNTYGSTSSSAEWDIDNDRLKSLSIVLGSLTQEFNVRLDSVFCYNFLAMTRNERDFLVNLLKEEGRISTIVNINKAINTFVKKLGSQDLLEKLQDELLFNEAFVQMFSKDEKLGTAIIDP